MLHRSHLASSPALRMICFNPSVLYSIFTLSGNTVICRITSWMNRNRSTGNIMSQTWAKSENAFRTCSVRSCLPSASRSPAAFSTPASVYAICNQIAAPKRMIDSIRGPHAVLPEVKAEMMRFLFEHLECGSKATK